PLVGRPPAALGVDIVAEDALGPHAQFLEDAVGREVIDIALGDDAMQAEAAEAEAQHAGTELGLEALGAVTPVGAERQFGLAIGTVEDAQAAMADDHTALAQHGDQGIDRAHLSLLLTLAVLEERDDLRPRRPAQVLAAAEWLLHHVVVQGVDIGRAGVAHPEAPSLERQAGRIQAGGRLAEYAQTPHALGQPTSPLQPPLPCLERDNPLRLDP